MSEVEKGIEQPDRILKTVKEFLNLNREIEMQRGLDLKILTPNQMLSRLPISLAQLNAGNNSEKLSNMKHQSRLKVLEKLYIIKVSKKLKNEIRKLLHSLYRSKKLTKNVYKSLVNIVRA